MANITGNEDNNTLDGDIAGVAEDDIIRGLEGNDILRGFGGNDHLDGGEGVDQMFGGLGNDTYVVDNALDIVTEIEGEGTDTVISYVNYNLDITLENLTLAGTTTINGTGNAKNNRMLGNGATNILNGDDGNDDLNGLEGNDTLNGGIGADVLNGGDGIDQMIGGLGDDIYVVDNVLDTVTEIEGEGVDTVASFITYTLAATLENLNLAGAANINGTGNAKSNRIVGNDGNNSLNGGAGNDDLIGLAGNDILRGGSGADALNGSDGADQMFGGFGDDEYVVDNLDDVVQEDGDTALDGIDKVGSFISYSLNTLSGQLLEHLNLVGTNNINGTGNAKNNAILGNSGNNVLNGLSGADTLQGGSGNDILLGGANDDSLTDNEGNDTLNGGTGNDDMAGGDGNDTYFVDASGDRVTETNSNLLGGVDLVNSSITYTLGANLENLTLTGAIAINGTGNSLNNKILGNGANNILLGLGGADTLEGGLGNDSLDGGSGNDTLKGGSGNDTLIGNFGADRMEGGDGNDIYYVNEVGDQVIEASDDALAGLDIVNSSISYTLGFGLENINLLGTANINGTGNAKNNDIVGNIGNNILTGLEGNDRFFGDNGNDTLRGGTGNDQLDGGQGADRMEGGDGNDIYHVDNVGDQVVEAFDDTLAGTGDKVISSIDYTLGFGLENLQLFGTASIGGIGNTKNNIIDGNTADNTLNGAEGDDSLWGNSGNDGLIGDTGNDSLDGGLGADTLIGGAGNDTYIIESSLDVVIEDLSDALGGGTDTVYASVTYSLASKLNIEHLRLTGTGNFNGTGNAKNNILQGNNGNNVLNGGHGHDQVLGENGNDTLIGGSGNDALISNNGNSTMNGGLGNDIFRFGAALGSANADTIQDFFNTTTENDVIWLNVQVFSAYGLGAIAADTFKAGSAATGFAPVPADANDRILYNTSSGQLFYDADGNGAGAAEHFATISLTGLSGTVTAADFVVV